MRRTIKLISFAAVAAILVAPPASASFGFQALGLTISGDSAGIHPTEVTTTLQLNTTQEQIEIEPGKIEPREFPDGQLKDLDVDLPPGFAGNPTAVPTCSSTAFVEIGEGLPNCPNASAIGYAAVKAEFDPIKPDAAAYFHVPIYNLEPSPGRAARIGFIVLSVPVTVEVGVREAPPYRVYAELRDASQAALLYGSKVTLWGNPASSSHDAFRGGCVNVLTASTIDEVISKGKCTAGSPPVPFLTSPRSCDEPLVATFRGVAWNQETATGTASAPARINCSALGFAAEALAQTDSEEADSPTGFSFDLTIDDEGFRNSAEGVTTFSDIKRTQVTLPEGMTVNPSQAEGLIACSEEQLSKETAFSSFGAGCPAAAKVGSVEVETPLLEKKVLHGSLFVATPYENPFDSLIALYMVVKDKQLGVAVKLPARVDLDGPNGRVRTTFGDPSAKDPELRVLPQLPLSHIHVQLRGGPRSPLVTPPSCGTYVTEALFTPWAEPSHPLGINSSFTIDSGSEGGPCPLGERGFAPGFEAGTLNNSAGSPSTFAMRFTRKDGEQEFSRASAMLPQGLVPKLAGIPPCSDAAIDAAKSRTGREELALPSCAAASQIGRVLGGAGAGSALTFVSGDLYLAGPFAGHPLSVVAITPVVAGPFDLGTVVVREGIDLNPNTYVGEIDATASDPIPRMLQGIPLRLRDLRIVVDRPDFIRNPTSCAEKRILGIAVGQVSTAGVSQRFQAADCASLGFKPKLTLTLTGQMKRTGNPAVRSVLIPRSGNANIGAATVLLPKSEFIDQGHISNPCTRVQFNSGECPPKSILGTAKATTSLLEAPLEGPVYFRSNGGERELPDLVADLRGQFHIILVGFIDSKAKRVRARFLSVPDAPVSRFELKLFGGKRGLLQNTRNLCRGKKPRFHFAFLGQNGRRIESQPRLRTSCNTKR